MKTKFIGLEGFGKIEALKTTRKVKKHYVKRTVRFFKKAVQVTYCFAKSFEKPRKKEKIKTPTLDACYKNARMGDNEFKVKILHFSRSTKKQGKKKVYAVRYTRGLQPISANFLKHKAVLGTITACVAGLFTLTTAFSAAGAENSLLKDADAESVSKSVSAYAEVAAAPIDTGIINDVASAITNGTQVAGLYIDGDFIGAVNDEEELYKAIDAVLENAKADYSKKTTAEYLNEIQVVPGDYELSDIMPISELMEKLSAVAQISITTQMYSEEEIEYDTEFKCDQSQSSDYNEVIQEGKSGIKRVTSNVTFVNGVKVDSEVIGSKVVSEPVSEVIAVGSLETLKEYGAFSTGTFIWPVPNTYSITSDFGYRWGTTHAGLDISNGVTDETIVASDSGVVVWSGYDNSGYGDYVIIDHGNGYQTLYGHCNSVYVSIGDYVSQGQAIAGMGSTGDSTGTHLHFEIMLGYEKLDPAGFVL